MDRMFSEILFFRDDARGLQETLENWAQPDPDIVLELLERASGKPYTTDCLLRFLHQRFPAEEVQKHRQRRIEKQLGLLEWEEEDWRKEFRWEAADGGARILEYLGQDADVQIPESFDGLPVRAVARSFFLRKKPLDRLLVPEGIEVGQVLPWEAASLWGRELSRPEIISHQREVPLPQSGGEGSRVMVIAKDYAVFGCYGADGDGAPKPLHWQVLRQEERRMLMISCEVLELLPYHRSRSAVLWPDCDLRAWLNDCFLHAAFTPQEQSLLLTTELTGRSNPMFGTRNGSTSQDRIFLLQPEELSPFSADMPLWSRMPGLSTQQAVTILPSGQPDYQGKYVNEPAGVRPAIWIRV